MGSVASVTEITARGSSFEDAVQSGLERANQTLRNVQHAWCKDFEVYLQDGRISEYQVTMKVTFVLEG